MGILLGREAREKMQKGANALSDIVKSTIGPQGLNVAIDRQYGSPLVTNDGISIAKSVSFDCPYMDMGAKLVREAASKTNEQGGDGTTGATILAQSMINDGLKNVAAGANAILIRRGMQKTLKEILSVIDSITIPVSSFDEMVKVASISAGDDSLGNTIATAIECVGKDGVVTIEESNSVETTIETTKGLRIDKGYASSYMVTDTDKMEAVLDKSYVFITDTKIDSIDSVLPIIEAVIEAKGRLLIIADMTEDVLSTIVLNKLKGAINCVCIKPPIGGLDVLEDIASVTGATVVSEHLGLSLDDVTTDMLGMADKIVSCQNHTVIVDGHGDKDVIDERVKKIKSLIEIKETPILLERLGKLSGGVAVIRVGAASEQELKEKVLRVEDSVNATKAAIDKGIVPGGGTTLVMAKKRVKIKLTLDEKIGRDIVINSLDKPLFYIAENAGMSGGEVVSKVKSLKDGYGFDALECKYKNMIPNGIIDPAKVIKSALINSVSVASSFITMEGAISSRKEKEND